MTTAWCFPDEQTNYTNGVLRAISDAYEILAPRLWAYEVRNSILMGLRRGRIIKSHAQTFLVSLASLPVCLTDPESYDDVFALAERYSLTVYDAAYIDLALREGLPLATLDKAMRQITAKLGIILFEP